MNETETHFYRYSPSLDLNMVGHDQVNRAAFFGDGIFETMVYLNGSIRFLKEHQERLTLGMKTLKINRSGLSIERLQQFLNSRYGNKKSLRVRWNVFRGGLGKYTPLNNDATDLILVQELEAPVEVKNQSYISSAFSISASPWSHCKTLNALSYVMANIERKERGMDEVILLDDKGCVSEAGSANIFWVKNGVFYTPSLSCNCIAGVGRRKILETLEEDGHTVIEGRFTVEKLLEAEQVFTSNVTGIAYIAALEQRSYSTTPIPYLHRLFI